MNPFNPGDIVKVKHITNFSKEFVGEIKIKEVREDLCRTDVYSGSWTHYTHLELVKAGMVSRMQDPPPIPESHPKSLPKDSGFTFTQEERDYIENGPWVAPTNSKDCLSRIKETMPDLHGHIEADPKGLPAAAPGAKFDLGKVKAGLLLDFGLALTEVAKVSTFGAKKYCEHGWLHTEDGIRRYQDAGVRHQLAGNREQIDPDSGLLHLAHSCWNQLAELELRLRRERACSPSCKKNSD